MDAELQPQAEFKLSARPPFDFYSSVEAEIEVRRMEGYPPLVDYYDGRAYWATLRLLSGEVAGVRVEPDPPDRGIPGQGLKVTLYCASRPDAAALEAARRTIARCWGLDEPTEEVYSLARRPAAVGRAVERHRGLRALTWQEAFQPVCIAVLLQNAPVARTNAMTAALALRYGIPVRFAGLELRHWFPPQRLAGVDPGELRSECRLGFRAERLVGIARALADGRPDLARVGEMPLAEAREALLTLKGIGEYSADFILLGMRRWEAFPVDVWSARQFYRVFFPGQTVPEMAAAAAAVRRRAEELWGSWRGLIWNFVLHELDQLAEECEREAGAGRA
ncbi:MAG: hypothetical protein K6T75_11380 [Acetobacteraceae bacterium]|nr:hypothetical protein [Acetobacteraceae bacterium]